MYYDRWQKPLLKQRMVSLFNILTKSAFISLFTSYGSNFILNPTSRYFRHHAFITFLRA